MTGPALPPLRPSRPGIVHLRVDDTRTPAGWRESDLERW